MKITPALLLASVASGIAVGVLVGRSALMRNDYSAIERECARAEDGYVPACVKGVALVWLRR